MNFSQYFKIGVITLFLFLSTAPGLHTGNLVFADEGDTVSAYPYTTPFIISAYYSPLPCQNRYATGSYDGDIRLNGRGTNGADGTPVYPGMIAAPKTYSFGTKMHVPGIGIVAVHDRGGAIVTAGERGHAYDRLDVWMGYGDQGLARALKWGKRTVNVTVYGITDSVVEDVQIEGYSPNEAVVSDCQPTATPVIAKTYDNEHDRLLAKIDDRFKGNMSNKLSVALGSGDKSDAVLQLQKELARMNFYKVNPTGVYDDLTAHAVMKFQQSQEIIDNEDESGAGYFGPQTRERMNELISARNYTRALVAQTTYEADGGRIIVYNEKDEDLAVASEEDNVEEIAVISQELQYGSTDPEVKELQKILSAEGFFTGGLFTEYFGDSTKAALIKFQLKHKIISSENDNGAGRVGPKTLQIINNLS